MRPSAITIPELSFKGPSIKKSERVNEVPVSSASEVSRALDAISRNASLSVQRRSAQLSLAIKRAPAA